MGKSRYEIIKPIGKGGMAEVFLAKDLMFDTNVALKVLLKQYQFDQQIKDRFLDEAKTLFRLSHPNIIKATGLVDEPDMVAYSMDYVDGVDLRSWIQNPNRSPQLDLIEHVYKPALDAVACAHDNGIIHRDLKPSNFMVSKHGTLKLMDFGIAKHSRDSSETVTGLMMGTPKYMSPEQVRSSKHVTVQSDIYSLGVILWELLAGRALYSDEALSAFDISVKIVTESLPPVDPKWDPIIAKATQKKPEDRFSSVEEFMAATRQLEPQPFKSSAHEEDETVYSAPSPPPVETTTVVETPVEETKIDSPQTHGLQSEPSSGNDSDEVICPRCMGKGELDMVDIKKWGNEDDWAPGPCAYCDTTGRASRYFTETYDPGDPRIFLGWREACLDGGALSTWVDEVSGTIDVHCDLSDDRQIPFIESFKMPVDWILDWNEGVVQFTEVASDQGIGLFGMQFPGVPDAQYFFVLRSGVEDKPAVVSSNKFDLLKAPLQNGFTDFEAEVYWTSGECNLGHSMHKVWQESSSVFFEFFDRKGAIKSHQFDLSSERKARATTIFWAKLIDSPLGFMHVSDEEEFDIDFYRSRGPDGAQIDGDYIKGHVSSFVAKGLANVTSCFNEEWAGSKYSRHLTFLGRFKMPSPKFARFSEGIYQDESIFGGGKSGIALVGIQFVPKEEPHYALLVRWTGTSILPLFKALPAHFKHPAYNGFIAHTFSCSGGNVIIHCTDDDGHQKQVQVTCGNKKTAELSVEFWQEIIVEERLNLMSL